jgi:hypothetical protein
MQRVKNSAGLGDKSRVSVGGLLDMANHGKLKGVWDVLCFDRKDGNLVWQAVEHNLVTTLGMNDLLTSGVGTKFAGLINNAAFSAVAEGDTMSSHAGWAEYVNYAESTRAAITWGTAAAGAIATTDIVDFTISGASGTENLQGLFITSNSTKSGTTGTLFAAGEFVTPTPPAPVVDDYVITASYSLSLANA